MTPSPTKGRTKPKAHNHYHNHHSHASESSSPNKLKMVIGEDSLVDSMGGLGQGGLRSRIVAKFTPPMTPPTNNRYALYPGDESASSSNPDSAEPKDEEEEELVATPKARASSPSVAVRAASEESCKGGLPVKPCHCKKSRCLKLYCECFARRAYCDGCKCTGCANVADSDAREEAIQVLAFFCRTHQSS